MRQLPLTAFALLLCGCFPDTSPDPVTFPPAPASCGNGLCELSNAEDCANCATDCPCCAAVFATGVAVQDPQLATGAPDGRGATLQPYGSLELTVGREIGDNPDGTVAGVIGADFSLTGQVTGTPMPQTMTCPNVTSTAGSVLIKAYSEPDWILVGVWSGGSSGEVAFDLLCGSVRGTHKIRLEAQEGATAVVDALKVTSCLQ